MVVQRLADTPLAGKRIICVVGGRRVDQRALTIMEYCARRLVELGYGVISGGAAGTDTAAERGACAADVESFARYTFPGHDTRIHLAKWVVQPADLVTATHLAGIGFFAKRLGGPSPLDHKTPYVRSLFIRNASMVLDCDAVLAWPGESGGTAHTIHCADARHMPVLNLRQQSMSGDRHWRWLVYDWLQTL